MGVALARGPGTKFLPDKGACLAILDLDDVRSRTPEALMARRFG